jgi:DNA-binding SARP family transcriptional activator
LLWDRVEDRQARSSLRQALRDVTSAIGSLAPELITTDVDSVILNRRLCWIDIQQALASAPLPSDLLADRFGRLATGESLEDLSGITPPFDHWLAAERSRFREQITLRLEAELEQHRAADPARLWGGSWISSRQIEAHRDEPGIQEICSKQRETPSIPCRRNG